MKLRLPGSALFPIIFQATRRKIMGLSPSGGGVGGGEPLTLTKNEELLGSPDYTGNQVKSNTDHTLHNSILQKSLLPLRPPQRETLFSALRKIIVGMGQTATWSVKAIAVLVLFISCNQVRANAQSTQVPNLIAPVQLNMDTTIINLNDFFIDPSKIDSISFSNNYKGHWYRTENTVQIVADNKLPALTELKLWSEGQPTSVLLKRSQKKAYEFTFNPNGKTYQTVQLAGEMNDWGPKKNNFRFDGTFWRATVELNPGVYQYQLVLDSKWQLDPGNKDSADNNNGGFNSIFKAGVSVAKRPVLRTLRSSKTGFTFASENRYSEVFAYWQNQRIPVASTNNASENSIEIPKDARDLKKSYIRVYAFNDGGLSNDLLIPLANGEVITGPKQLDRSDEHAMSIYSILVDRFYDGDSTNDQPVVFKDLKPKANYYGGDLAGITEKLKAGYFDSLHINTLWISPVLQNPEGAYREFPEPHDWYSGYHGYWPISLTKIDHRFGNDKVFKNLVDEAHKLNDNVLVDLVANHVHEECPIIKQHPEWATQLNLPDGRKNIRLWDEYRLTTWFDTFLPTLDFSNKDVIKLEVDSSLLWVTKYGIDGFRHDATKHIATAFWRSLTLNLKKIEGTKPFYQIGETYGSKELIASYIGSGLLDGQFDFNLYFDARNAFAKDSEGFQKMAGTLMQSINFYGSHHLMGNITGNHDQPRVASLAGGGLSFNEDARKAGWDRNITVGSDIAYNKMACLIAFTATIPGVPVLYYGDEIAMPGAGDPDNRRMMRFGNLSPKELQLKKKVAKLFGLRAQHLSLTYGDFNLLEASETTLAYQRSYFDETTIVVFNNASQSKTITVNLASVPTGVLQSQFGSTFTYNKGTTLSVELPAKSFEVVVTSGK
jgi:glycosidase